MKPIIALALAAALLLGLAACGGGEPTSSSSAAEPEPSSALPASSSQPEAEPLSALPANDGSIGARTTLFACESAPHILSAGQNGCYSPLSLYIALAMVAPGATDETLAELLAALQAEGEDPAALAAEVGALLEALPFEDSTESATDPALGPESPTEQVETGRLSIDNAIWLNDHFTFKAPFADLAQNTLGAELFEVPVPSPETNARINGWALEKTNGLVDPGVEMKADETQSDALCLMNALYFKNKWGGFNEERNTEEPFTLAGGGEVEATYMNQTYEGVAHMGEGYTAAQKRMWNGATVTLVLPDEGTDPADLMTPERLYGMLDRDNYDSVDVILKLPKFTTQSELDLIEALGQLGVRRAFDPQAAQLDEMFDRDPQEFYPPYISQVSQDTKIIVSEEGIEAAAVTVIALPAPAAGIPMEVTEIELLLTRPFLYFITLDAYPTSPLFMGTVYDPTIT